MKKVVIGNDHGAVELKQKIALHLERRGYEVTNMGIDAEDAADYPDIAKITCSEYKKGGYDFGIVCCGTGIGISIAANKVKGIRCALVHDLFTAEMAKAHNNANFLAFGGRVQYQVAVEEMIDTFIETQFAGTGRHERRVDKIMDIEVS